MMTVSELFEFVIPASVAHQESFWKAKKDSGQAGMTDYVIRMSEHFSCNGRVIRQAYRYFDVYMAACYLGEVV